MVLIVKTKSDMEKDLEKLYNRIDEYQIFGDFSICKNCKKLCSRKIFWHWLLDCEVDIFTKSSVLNINDAFFFRDGKCSFLIDGKCSIYDKRPLECRVSPISLHKFNNDLYWIIDIDCIYYKKYFVNNKQLILDFISKIEPYFTNEIIENIKRISNVIDNNFAFIENVNYKKVIKLNRR